MFGLLTQCPMVRYQLWTGVMIPQVVMVKDNIIGCEYDVLHTEQVRHVRHLHVIVCPYTLW